ncbi:DUF6804 family protein [Microbacterium sp. zg.B48]|uniref:DUF6804 family protein n=1 Tax=Microbacterium sp. zg.B48 TaxID=2969408 RepID=UPI0027D46A4C|nr:DUF6804 family protein [Microbacterium sp. zg.B48]
MDKPVVITEDRYGAPIDAALQYCGGGVGLAASASPAPAGGPQIDPHGTDTTPMAPSTPAAPEFQRNAFAPGILAAIACLAGIALVGHEYYLAVQFVIAILAVIVGWFAIQAGQWWWAPVMLAIAILWNPFYPFAFSGPWWAAAHIAAAAAFLAAGATVRTRRNPTR